MAKSTVALSRKYLIGNYARFPVSFTKGKGCYLWDEAGKKYLDLLSGISVNLLGHRNKDIVRAIASQSKKLIHVSNYFYNEPAAELAEALVTRAFTGGKVFFCNSGTEANEAAIKLARIVGTTAAKGKIEIISFLDSFHGRTFGALSATGQDKLKSGMGPMLPGFKFAKLNDIASVEKLIGPKTAAVIIELIQGESGVNVAEPRFVNELRRLTEKNGTLLIVDEVQTGLGRTGRFFAYQGYGIVPDIVTLAKGLGGGLPIGALIAKDEFAAQLVPGTHGSTFGGNPVACKAGLATIERISRSKLTTLAKQRGEYFRSKLTMLGDKHPGMITGIRGVGLMLGIGVGIDAKAFVVRALEKGLIINAPRSDTIRLLPPLTITSAEIDRAIRIFDRVFASFSKIK